MGKSLADQLMGAGLVDSKKAKKLQREKRKEKKQAPAQQDSQARQQAQRAAQAEKDRELNRQRREAEAAREKAAQVQQLLDTHRVPADGEVRFQFADPRNGRIKQLYVSRKTQDRLASGQLVICAEKNGYCIVPADTGQRVEERQPDAIVFRVDPAQQQADEDDPYKDFPIPDDLDW